ncbi:MAG TPA: SDR family oxidoreductase [Acidimicrobiales bacterium]|nr:SDR family oxidoreductase [Acidimicrobiales bacterium]
MKSQWDEAAAAEHGQDDLGRLVYASRLLGADPALVLAGGGNSSVKTEERDLFGEPVAVLHVKGSGWDMATIGRAGFAPLRLDRVAMLATLDELDDGRMAGELRAAGLDPRAPAPSVESILHALLPPRFVLHSHADAVLALTDTPGGVALAEETFGPDVLVVPYVMPGFALAKLCAERLAAAAGGPAVTGLVLARHGLFTFDDDARGAYERHLDLVGRALDRVEAALAAVPPPAAPEPVAVAGFGDGADDSAFGTGDRQARPVAGGELGGLATLRRDLSAAAGRPLVLRRWRGDDADRFASRPDLGSVTQSGPATPDHVLRTKRVPLLGRDVDRYAAAYRGYVAQHRHRLGDRPLTELDPAPRVVVDPDLGVVAAGERVADAAAAAEIYAHTAWVIERAEAVGGYAPVTEAEAFAVEYWELEQAKLARRPAPAPFTGRVALVTGAASGIGRATASALLEAGAAVVGLDLDPAVGDVGDLPAFVPVTGDAADAATVSGAVAAAVDGFGGLDVLVLCAGVFPPTQPVAELDPAQWERALSVNATAAALALREAHPYLRVSPVGGSVAVVASKNVPAPGTGAAAYSASKAALTQLARVAALEWGPDGIRVNVVHPDAVFDTGLWDDDLVARRAAAYGLTPEQYRTRNVLGAEVASRHVAAAVLALCGDGFARTTGAQVTVDGGNDRVI